MSELRNSGVGCHLADLFVAVILYADDLTLMAPSRSAMQKLLDVCEEYSSRW